MSPLIRTWLAARLPDWVDHAFHIFHPSVNAIWDDWIRKHGDLDWTTHPAGTLDFPRLKPCSHPVFYSCGAAINAPCVTKTGRVMTGYHRARRP